MHRLQHLRLRRLHDGADPLHPEPDAWARSGGAAGIPSGSGRGSDARVLVVGAGPAGLEAAMMLGRRGYEVVLAEAGDELGGRVAREARLPGLAAWIRVLDYRKASWADGQRRAGLRQPAGRRRGGSSTGSTRWRWRPARPGGATPSAAGTRGRLPLDAGLPALTPDDLMAGRRPQRRARGAVRRRPLLHGRRAGRAAGRRGPRGDAGDAGGRVVGLDRQHDGAAAHPAAGCSRLGVGSRRARR